MNGWIGLLGLSALVLLFVPVSLELELIEKAIEKIRRLRKQP